MQNELVLGPWTNNDQIESTLGSAVQSMLSEFIFSEIEVNKFQMEKIVYRYGTDKVTMIGLKDLDGRLYNDFYYESALETYTFYRSTRNQVASRRALRKDIKRLMKTGKEGTKSKTVILMHIDNEGFLESTTLVLPKGRDNRLNSASLGKFQPGVKDGNTIKTKMLIIY